MNVFSYKYNLYSGVMTIDIHSHIVFTFNINHTRGGNLINSIDGWNAATKTFYLMVA